MIHRIHTDGGPCLHVRCKRQRVVVQCDDCDQSMPPALGANQAIADAKSAGWKVFPRTRVYCRACWAQCWASRELPPDRAVQRELFADQEGGA